MQCRVPLAVVFTVMRVLLNSCPVWRDVCDGVVKKRLEL